MNTVFIGKKIKLARKAISLTQRDLANKLGISWEMISRYENGKSNPLAHIAEIAYHLSQSPDYFFRSDLVDSNADKNKIPFFYSNIGNWVDNIARFDTIYMVPDWTAKRFTDLFALKLGGITCRYFQISANDIGIFTLTTQGENIKYSLSSHDIVRTKTTENDSNILPGLVYIERRFA